MENPISFYTIDSNFFYCSSYQWPFTVAQEGGIRKKYNRLFSFIYSLPGSKLTVETKSFVKFHAHTNSCNISFILNYNMDMLDVRCTISYFDDTAFNNGTTKKWSVSKYCSEEEVLKRMQDYLYNLPNSPLVQKNKISLNSATLWFNL